MPRRKAESNGEPSGIAALAAAANGKPSRKRRSTKQKPIKSAKAPARKPRGRKYGKDPDEIVYKLQEVELYKFQALDNHFRNTLQGIQLKQAEISFRFAMEVRNKLIDAYREVMRMNV